MGDAFNDVLGALMQGGLFAYVIYVGACFMGVMRRIPPSSFFKWLRSLTVSDVLWLVPVLGLAGLAWMQGGEGPATWALIFQRIGVCLGVGVALNLAFGIGKQQGREDNVESGGGRETPW